MSNGQQLKCVFSQLVKSDAACACVARTEVLPFVPTIGMSISDGADAFGIIDVYYSLEDGMFHVTLETDSIEHLSGGDIQDMIECGWSLAGDVSIKLSSGEWVLKGIEDL